MGKIKELMGTIEDEVLEGMGRDYTKHLAEAMGNTKMRIINELFDEAYANRFADYDRIEMPRRGRYQVWQGLNKVADHIKHRKEALAVMKLLKENDDGTA